ncbi:MAG: hypothetical protein K6F58_05755 [Bacteroidales bacterium]|nr:hypothetical protein [Bacteroidales bacterium]
MAAIFAASGTAVSAASDSAVSLFFRINSSSVDMSFGGNGNFSSSAGSILGGVNSDKGNVRICVRGAASPDGPLAFNRKLAAERAWAAVDLLKHINPSLSDSQITVSMVDEDWAGLAAWLRSSDKAWAADALRIVESGKADREQRLRELYVGEAWDELAANCFPKLRRAEVSLEVSSPAQALAPVRNLGTCLHAAGQVNQEFADSQQLPSMHPGTCLHVAGQVNQIFADSQQLPSMHPGTCLPVAGQVNQIFAASPPPPCSSV